MKTGRKKKAIVISFNGKSNAGGVERVVYYIDAYFNSRGITTKIIDEAFLMGSFIGKLYARLFNYRHFRKRKSIYLARYASAWLWITGQWRNIVISHGESAPFFPVDFLFIHGSYHAMELAYGKPDEKLSRMANLQRLACRHAKAIIAVSEKVKQDLARYYETDLQKVRVLNNCVDTRRFFPVRGNDTNVNRVLFVGRLENGKGLAALQRLAEIIEQTDNWELVIACNHAGNSELFSAFKHTTVKTGLTVENINAEAYTKADLMFFPSRFEGFEMVTLEALAAGIPVAAYPVGAAAELARRHFPGVHLLEALDDDILSRFTQIITGFRASMTPQELHQRVKEEFGKDVYMQKLDTILGPAFSHNAQKNDAPVAG